MSCQGWQTCHQLAADMRCLCCASCCSAVLNFLVAQHPARQRSAEESSERLLMALIKHDLIFMGERLPVKNPGVDKAYKKA